MLVAVMQIRQVNVTMHQAPMAVGMGMQFSWRIGWSVLMLMVFVVTMQMLMLQGLVDVIVFVMFGQMQPDARNH
jgi:hypothetical protein